MTDAQKIILVTGASSGIGKATALQLLEDGHVVYGAARRVPQMADLETAGGHAIGMDVTDEVSVQQGIDRIIAEQGRIDVLINNAGYAVYGAVEDVAIDDARRQFEVNMFGLARVTQLALPHMRAQASGTIINISSVGGKIYSPMGAWYHATKHALEGWSDCLRLEVNPFGIDVVIVEPGAIKTEFLDVMHDPMVERSDGGPYAEMAEKLATSGKRLFEGGLASDPSVIAKVCAKAVRARRPRTRYAAGLGAKPLKAMRWAVSDRLFDRIVTAL